MDLPVHQIHSSVGTISVSVSLLYNPFLNAPSSFLLLPGNLLRTPLLLGSLHAVSRLCLDNSYPFVLMTISPPASQLSLCWLRPPALSLDRSDPMYSHRSQRTPKETQRPSKARAGKALFCWMGTWYLPVPWHWAKFTWLCCISSALNLPEPLKAFCPFPARVIQAEGSPFLLLQPVPGKGGVQGAHSVQTPAAFTRTPMVSVCSSSSVLRTAQHVLCASWEPSGSLLGLQVGKGEHYRDKQQHNSVLGLGVEAVSHTFERKQPQGIKNIHSFFFFLSS